MGEEYDCYLACNHCVLPPIWRKQDERGAWGIIRYYLPRDDGFHDGDFLLKHVLMMIS